MDGINNTMYCLLRCRIQLNELVLKKDIDITYFIIFVDTSLFMEGDTPHKYAQEPESSLLIECILQLVPNTRISLSSYRLNFSIALVNLSASDLDSVFRIRKGIGNRNRD